MEPVTHVLTGACLARAGLNRRAAYATLGMAVAAEFPDIDTLWSLKGPISGFEHHRGITHTLIGVPVEAAFLLLLLIALHKVRQSRAGRESRTRNAPLTRAPVRWAVLYSFLVLGLLSHLLLDFTNNYGLRPFAPFNPHWYAASIVFIFDPLLFLVLVVGLTLPSLFRLIAEEVGTRQGTFRGAGWARAALLGMLTLWSIRTFEHSRAVALASTQTMQAPAPEPTLNPDPTANAAPGQSTVSSQESQDNTPEPRRPLLNAQKVLANPDPFNMFRWYTAADFGPAYRLGTADTRSETLLDGRVLNKPSPSPALLAAEASDLGRVYLDWSSMPLLGASTADVADPSLPSGAASVVTFEDLRFMGSSSFLRRNNRNPLTGTVVLDGAGRVLAEGIDGRFGR